MGKAVRKKVNKRATLWIGVVMLAVLIVLAVLAPVICSFDPLEQDLYATLAAPFSGATGVVGSGGSSGLGGWLSGALGGWLSGWMSGENGGEGTAAVYAVHILGTDQLGRDILSRLLYAARTDLFVMAAAEIVPFLLGTMIGMMAGYFGGKVNWVISLITDTFIAFPYYLLVIVVAFVTGAGIHGIFVTFMLVGWIVYARVAKALAAEFRAMEWVEAAKVIGYSDLRILLFEIFPNVLPQVVVVLMTDMAALLAAIVTLGYLGIGISAPTPDWGSMIAEGQGLITSAPHLSLLPGLMVVYTGIALSLIGDGLADRWRR